MTESEPGAAAPPPRRGPRRPSPPLLALVAIAVQATSAVGQAPAVTRAEALRSLFSGISPGTELQVVTMGGDVREGRFEGLGAGAFDVTGDLGPVSIGFQDVRAIAESGSHPVQGALWGVGGGVLVGIFFGSMIASFDCTTTVECNRTEKEGAQLWGTALGLAGGGLGFWLGGRQFHWHPIFP